jgi:molybdenum cofactor biosynthesis enzyme MoaA
VISTSLVVQRFTLEDVTYRTGGPARYARVRETGGLVGFITPLTHNFCESCNRVRVTCTGTLYMCLGQEDAADLRAPLRASEADDLLRVELQRAIAGKPKGDDRGDRAQQRRAIGAADDLLIRHHVKRSACDCDSCDTSAVPTVALSLSQRVTLSVSLEGC